MTEQITDISLAILFLLSAETHNNVAEIAQIVLEVETFFCRFVSESGLLENETFWSDIAHVPLSATNREKLQ